MALHVVVVKYKDVIGAKDAIAAVKDAGIKLEDQADVLNSGDGDLEFKEGKDAGAATASSTVPAPSRSPACCSVPWAGAPWPPAGSSAG